jgi:hypothetical protein
MDYKASLALVGFNTPQRRICKRQPDYNRRFWGFSELKRTKNAKRAHF